MDANVRVAEVSAGRGAAWLAESFSLFRAAPMAWVGLTSGWLVILFVILLVPILGPVLVNLLQPVFFASFAIAAHRQTQGEPVAMGDLFLGFRRNLRPLMNLGLITAVLQLGIVLIMNKMGFPSWPAERAFDLREYVVLLQQHVLTLWVGLGLMMILSGAFWFAPQLVAFHGMPTSHAIRWSVYAALANFGAVLVYGVVLFVMLFLAWIPFGLGLLFVVPMFVISTYIGYRDVFEKGSDSDSR
jgi:hypothetical protein